MSRKRWIWIGVLVAALVVIGAGAWASRGQVAYANIATGYAAKMTCSCLHVSGRPLESCLADFPEDARNNITISENGDVVRASVLFGAISSEAKYEQEFGCSIVN
ncbi:MAG: hypothetical protein NT015_04825 [Alphaproteobacteria bacterium]|nr:hypothetical protein [Alphaproteobacteria bacterium]